MAGFWPQSYSQVNDLNGKPVVGAKAFFYAGGTTDPITVYRDYGMVVPHTNPLSTDGWGRFPAVFVDDAIGFYRVRLTDAGGVLLYDADQIPVIGPTTPSGDTPSAPVDPDGVAKTGDLKPRYGTGFHEGWVRCNARTIGSATSGASERAAADCQPLYEHLWNSDASLVVLGGRGGSASSDWSANKPITLPDLRGRALVGLDTMGGTAAGAIPAATVLGWGDGEATHKLILDEIPVHDHGGKTSTTGAHQHTYWQAHFGAGYGGGANDDLDIDTNAKTSSEGDHFHTITAQGGGASHNNLQPSRAVTIYIRL